MKENKKFTIELGNNRTGHYIQHIVWAESHEEARVKLQDYFDALGELTFYRMMSSCESN